MLSVNPQEFESKLDDLRNLFVNAHHLLNLYRPHQARESLILMMEEQRDRSREEIKEMDRVKKSVEDLLEQLKAEGLTTESPDGHEKTAEGNTLEGGGPPREHTTMEDARKVWGLLDNIGED